MLARIYWKLYAWWVLMTWHPVRDRTPEYAALIASAVEKARRVRSARGR